MNTHRVLLAGAFGLSLFGCASASMNKAECRVSDWQMIGYEDGAAGHGSQRLRKHRKSCAKHGIVPDLAAYQQGRSEGLQEYCQPPRGFALGRGGASYGGVCPAELQADFLEAYNAGHHLWQLRTNVSHANRQISHRKRTLAKVKKQLVAKGAALIREEATNEQRLVLLAEMKELYERRGQLQREIDHLEIERTQHREELYVYQAELELE